MKPVKLKFSRGAATLRPQRNQAPPGAVRCAIKASSSPGTTTKATPRTKRTSSAWAIFVAVTFFCAVGTAVVVLNLPPAILLIYLAASVVTFIAYAIDKSAARKGRWRTKEGTLHVLAMIGGWPGAFVAQRVLRHKSRKQPFRMIFLLTVILNCAALVWLSTPGGRDAFG